MEAGICQKLVFTAFVFDIQHQKDRVKNKLANWLGRDCSIFKRWRDGW